MDDYEKLEFAEQAQLPAFHDLRQAANPDFKGMAWCRPVINGSEIALFCLVSSGRVVWIRDELAAGYVMYIHGLVLLYPSDIDYLTLRIYGIMKSDLVDKIACELTRLSLELAARNTAPASHVRQVVPSLN